MDWWHDTSRQWMEARRDVITASEIKSCLSAYNRATKEQKAGEVILPAFASLWMEKRSERHPDTGSRGAAARGHILEPYAVSDHNDNLPELDKRLFMYHWDDAIIKNGGCGWSPDGLSVPQEIPGPSVRVGRDHLAVGSREFEYPLPTAFIEVKSYEASNHAKKFLTRKDKLDERWQMAVAFHVLPSLQTGVLLFYSIDTPYSFEQVYKRDELSEEIEQVAAMVELWNINSAKLEQMQPLFIRSWSEEEVHDRWMEEMRDPLRL